MELNRIRDVHGVIISGVIAVVWFQEQNPLVVTIKVVAIPAAALIGVDLPVVQAPGIGVCLVVAAAMGAAHIDLERLIPGEGEPVGIHISVRGYRDFGNTCAGRYPARHCMRRRLDQYCRRCNLPPGGVRCPNRMQCVASVTAFGGSQRHIFFSSIGLL